MLKRIIKTYVVCSLFVLCGCDPLTIHKVTSTVFDGVPSLPSPERYCQEYHEKKLKEEQDALKAKESSASSSRGSSHPPYAEKKCNNCHDKSKDGGLIVPKDQLCFVCHPKIISKPFVHGPASVGECQECHDPHSSLFPALLKVESGALCVRCHKEKRKAEAMHDKVTAKGIFCMDCHNPHAGDAAFFLR